MTEKTGDRLRTRSRFAIGGSRQCMQGGATDLGGLVMLTFTWECPSALHVLMRIMSPQRRGVMEDSHDLECQRITSCGNAWS